MAPTWKTLEDLLRLASTRSADDAVEVPLQVLRSKSIMLPVEIPKQADDVDANSTTLHHQGTQASCRLCHIPSFPEGVAQQRAHFKSDWHVYNLAAAQSDKGRPVVTEEEFNQLKREEEEEEEEEEDAYSTSSSSESEDDDDTAAAPIAEPRSNFALFPLVASSPPLVVARTHRVLASTAQELMQLLPQTTRRFTCGVLLYRSGHFAAAVYEDGKLVQHKTEHRYTTRKKQGGSQASHDTRAHKAKSAGAQLRRYGEQTMRERVAKVLAEWPQWKQQCDRVFYCIPERAKSLFFTKSASKKDGGGGDKFASKDERCRKIPFMTQRPTLDECERVYQKLCRVDLFVPRVEEEEEEAVVVEEAEPARRQETLEEIEARKAKEDEQRYREMGYFDRAIHLVCRDEEDSSQALLAAAGDGDDVNCKSLSGHTALHLAAELGKLDLCRTLLFELGADPTIPDLVGRVPYQLAKLPAVRLLFREFRGAKEEDNADEDEEEYWHRSQIPEPPKAKTEEDAERKREREREKRRRQAQKKKEDKEAAAIAAAAPPPPPPPPEGPLCSLCGASVKGKKKKDLFYQGDKVFCQQTCMREHGRRVMQAALDNRKL